MRKIIHVIELTYPNKLILVRIATTNTDRIPDLIEQNRGWWDRPQPFTQWKIKERKYDLLNLPEELYEAHISDCEVVDDFDESVLTTNRPDSILPPIPQEVDPADIPTIGTDDIQRFLEENGLFQ